MNTNNEQNFLHKIADFISDYFTDIGIVLGGVISNLGFFCFTDEAIKFWAKLFMPKAIVTPESEFFVNAKGLAVIIALIGVALIFIFTILHIRKQSKISKLKKEHASLLNDKSAILADLKAVITGYLWGIGSYLQMKNDSQFTDRITVYSHDSKLKVFIPMDRICLEPTLDSYGRSSYPDKEGYIGIAWRTGESFVEGLPDYNADSRAYINAVESGKVPKSLHKTLRLKSRFYYGRRISDSRGQKHLAVLMIESTDPHRWSKEDLDKYFEHEIENFSNIFERVYPYMAEFSKVGEIGL